MTKEKRVAARISTRSAGQLCELMESGGGSSVTEVIEAGIAALHVLRIAGLAPGYEDTQGGIIRASPIPAIPAGLEAFGSIANQRGEAPPAQIIR